ncbi:MAG: ribonuclease P protein component [Cyanobacteria bacterium]|nr:ribonuclease P protein component [Cyanobacteriota bacterium]
MLAQRHRLKSALLFEQTLAEQRLFSCPAFVVYALPAKSPQAAVRIGFIVSKKVEKRATRRNKIKRRLRALSRAYLLPSAHWQTTVIIARQAAANWSFEALNSAFQQMAKVLQTPS